MEISFNTGKELYTLPIGSSHGFYDKMGWIPEQSYYSYIDRYHGGYFHSLLRELCSCTSLEAVTKLKQLWREDLAYLLRKEQRLPPKIEITDAQLWDQRAWFAELQKKTIPYLSGVYIPNWLYRFRHNVTQYGDPHSVLMVPSPWAKESWRKAIKQGTEYQSCNYGEHLAPHMTEEQLLEYKEILASKQLPHCSFFRRPLVPLMLSTPHLRKQHAWEMFREKGERFITQKRRIESM